MLGSIQTFGKHQLTQRQNEHLPKQFKSILEGSLTYSLIITKYCLNLLSCLGKTDKYLLQVYPHNLGKKIQYVPICS